MAIVTDVTRSWSATVTAGASVSVSAVVVADGDDYFEFWVQGAGAGDKTVSGSSINTWFSGAPL